MAQAEQIPIMYKGSLVGLIEIAPIFYKSHIFFPHWVVKTHMPSGVIRNSEHRTAWGARREANRLKNDFYKTFELDMSL